MAMTQLEVEVPHQLLERRRPFHFLWYVLAFLIAIAAVRFVVFNPRWEWRTVGEYHFDRRVLAGLANTVQLTIVSSALGLIFGVVIAACRISNNLILRVFGGVYIWIVRAEPT
jgi:polar amino acid transport system permease protein